MREAQKLQSEAEKKAAQIETEKKIHSEEKARNEALQKVKKEAEEEARLAEEKARKAAEEKDRIEAARFASPAFTTSSFGDSPFSDASKLKDLSLDFDDEAKAAEEKAKGQFT